jgi:hypothetical protein
MIDPKNTRAYNHYRLDGDKPVIPNKLYKDTYESEDVKQMEEILKTYALDPTQKYLLTEKLTKLYEKNKTNLP